MPGRFVTFEGGEGSGKSTQVARLAARLRALGLDPLVTREPGGTPVAEGIRALLLDPERRPVPLTEALLMEASRAELVEAVIRPALAAGRMVLCDRYGDSTLAYQGAGRGLDAALLEGWNRAATGGLEPDLTLLFDIDPAAGLERRHGAAGAPNRLDREPLAFHQRVRARYLELAAAAPRRWVVLEASRPSDELESRVWEAVSRLLPAHKS
ncbi:MAG TPA: dTMP kinase [Candidatus Acidoferrales bacterium]|nr:dTMP kinase [Candidatus Acidoferrales bacterium]